MSNSPEAPFYYFIGGSEEYCVEKSKELEAKFHHDMKKLRDKWNFVITTPFTVLWPQDDDDENIEVWLKENIKGKYEIPEQYNIHEFQLSYILNCICFDDEEDVIAFKLRWL